MSLGSRDHECPTCGAAVGERCTYARGRKRGQLKPALHAARVDEWHRHNRSSAALIEPVSAPASPVPANPWARFTAAEVAEVVDGYQQWLEDEEKRAKEEARAAAEAARAAAIACLPYEQRRALGLDR
jgi:hypothetical protein